MMTKTTKLFMACLCAGALGLAACGTEGGGGEEKPGLQTFELKYCDSDTDCGSDFQCSAVYCADRCMPDPNGKCLPCNAGHAGQCLPKPPTGCDAVKCAAGEECLELCTGLCDVSTNKCIDVACEAVCVPSKTDCTSDAECGQGFHCEVACAKCADPTMPASAGSDRAAGAPAYEPPPKCLGGECIGRCVADPQGCDYDKECGEGFVCEPVMCPAMCAPDGIGGCLPCNGGKMGQCVPAPKDGCKSDAECGPGRRCQQLCMGWCDAFAPDGATDVACKQECKGECVPAQPSCDVVKCPAGTECQVLCSACAGEAADKAAGAMADPAVPTQIAPPCGECMVQCVPIPPPPKGCNADGDCLPGQHCEPVYCDMMCRPDGFGGCLPCNDGWIGQCVTDPINGCLADADCPPDHRCETTCMGACEPMGGCFEECFGQCVPMQKGCSSDMDCGKGQRCEWLCTEACPTPRGGASDRADPAFWAPECTGQCFGQCVDVIEPGKCNANTDCPAGYVCEPVYCAQYDSDKCFPDRKGGCGPMPPCNDGWLGECVPKPVEGCYDDSQCDPGMECRIQCMGGCSAGGGCTEACFGECVPKQSGCGPDQPCPAGFECQMMCVDCAPGTDCLGGCFGQCIPTTQEIRCNADVECGPGFHCELVFCTMECGASADGAAKPACLPCNDGYLGVCTPDAQTGCQGDAMCAAGEVCQVLCTGVCDPNGGCKEECFGQCVPKQQGCSSDADCGEGWACEKLCPPCGGGATPTDPSGAEYMPAPPCVDAECYGQCVPRAATCGDGVACPAGQVCVEKFECPPCVYAEPACPMTCAVAFECVAVPSEGCKGDAECAAGQKCLIACPMMCSPEGCSQDCQGVCV